MDAMTAPVQLPAHSKLFLFWSRPSLTANSQVRAFVPWILSYLISGWVALGRAWVVPVWVNAPVALLFAAPVTWYVYPGWLAVPVSVLFLYAVRSGSCMARVPAVLVLFNTPPAAVGTYALKSVPIV